MKVTSQETCLTKLTMLSRIEADDQKHAKS